MASCQRYCIDLLALLWRLVGDSVAIWDKFSADRMLFLLFLVLIFLVFVESWCAMFSKELVNKQAPHQRAHALKVRLDERIPSGGQRAPYVVRASSYGHFIAAVVVQSRRLFFYVFAMGLRQLINIQLLQVWGHAQKMFLNDRIPLVDGIAL